VKEHLSDSLSVLNVESTVTITFNRPGQLNAFTSELLDEMAALLQDTAEDPTVHVVVISGAGRAFSAGADLEVYRSAVDPLQPGVDTLVAANRVIQAIRALPQPVIAAVNGPAVGVGCSLALACDLVIAAETAYFLLPFVNIALMPDGGATALIPAAIGRSRAMQMALVPDRLSAATALEWGLIYRVVANDDLQSAVDALTTQLAAGSAPALTATKRAVNALTLANLDAAITGEVNGQTRLLASNDFKEAVVAFSERRPPRFSGT
jgi:enoyl-CoA hydratase